MDICFDGAPIRHGDFHNIAFLLLFASAAALVLRLAGVRFGDSFLFAGIGCGRVSRRMNGFSAKNIAICGRGAAEMGNRDDED